jgi:low temperature requirement protein LtrA
MASTDRFKAWFWQPPRAHGDIIRDRVVSPVELLYDLVYVAAISQAAATMSAEVSITTFFRFATVFALIWLAWINGSLYLELHGRDDGRTRSYVFIQIAILSLLAIFAAQAPGADGTAFAIVYAAFLAVMTWLWQSVRLQDSADFLAITRRYVLVMLGSTVAIAVSALVPAESRLAIWAAYAVLFVGFFAREGFNPSFGRGVVPTRSMTERFGLFTIIVLGEVVIGVVDGVSHARRDALTIVTGVLALGIAFGFWWIYFDVIGNRLPRHTGRSVAGWTLIHLPITLAIAATGAGMVGLLAHAADAKTPPEIAWLISGAVAAAMLCTIAATRALVVYDRLSAAFQQMAAVMVIASVVSLVVGYLAPAAPVLVLAFGAILTVTWLLVVRLYIRANAWPPHELERIEAGVES